MNVLGVPFKIKMEFCRAFHLLLKKVGDEYFLRPAKIVYHEKVCNFKLKKQNKTYAHNFFCIFDTKLEN